jgi:hypothetical protein
MPREASKNHGHLAVDLETQRVTRLAMHLFDESPTGQSVIHDSACLEKETKVSLIHCFPAQRCAQEGARHGRIGISRENGATDDRVVVTDAECWPAAAGIERATIKQ